MATYRVNGSVSFWPRPAATAGQSQATGSTAPTGTTATARGNVDPCCSRCNYAKRTLSPDEFLSLVEAIYRHAVER